MEDKAFLSYFWDISQYPNKQLKFTAAKNIVQTLLTVENIKKSGTRKLSGADPATGAAPTATTAILKKYRNDDFGHGITEDLNYTLSRLIKGMTAENNAVKEGFYMAFSLVLSTFHSISPISLLKTICRETAASQATGKRDVKCMKMGRAMLFSAICKGNLIFHNIEKETERIEFIHEFVNGITEYYKETPWLQSLIIKVLLDLIEQIKEHSELLETLNEDLCKFMAFKKNKKGGFLLPPFLANMTSLLMIFVIKKLHKLLKLKCKANLIKPEKISEVNVFIENLPINSIGMQKYFDFLINSSKSLEKISLLWSKVLMPKIADEEKGDHFRQITFILLTKMLKSDKKPDLAQLSNFLLEPEFIKIWARSLHSSGKSKGQQIASEAENAFSEFFEKNTEKTKSAEALKYLCAYYGPDPMINFTPTRHAKLYKILLFSLLKEDLVKYLEYLSKFDFSKKSPQNKDAQIYPFVQFTNLLNMPNSLLSDDIITQNLKHIISSIVSPKFKHIKSDLIQVLYSAIGQLNKRFPEADSDPIQKGFMKSKMLWTRQIHDLIVEFSEKTAESEKLRKKAVLEADEISKNRIKIDASISELKKVEKSEKVSEKPQAGKKRKMSEHYENTEIANKLITLRNIALSFEKLILNLAIFLFTESEEDTYSSIEELLKCYENLDIIGQAILIKSNKKHADEASFESKKSEAMNVYIDFLVEILTRPHMFLREIGNFAFQQIAKEITAESLQNLLNIITTPNVQASKMMAPVERIEQISEKKNNDESESEENEDEKNKNIVKKEEKTD